MVNIDYKKQEIIGRLIQLLETIHIIENSNSPDTVVGRSIFLKECFINMSEIRENPQIGSILQEGIDHYKKIYYDKIVSEAQIKLISNSDVEYLLKFIHNNVYRSFYSFIDKQLIEIKKLKKEDSKENRKVKFVDLVKNLNFDILSLGIDLENNSLKCDNQPNFIEIENIVLNYFFLKLEDFDEFVFCIENDLEVKDENKIKLNWLGIMQIKWLKSKLYNLKSKIVNQPYKIKLIISGDKIGMSLDSEADADLISSIKNLFSKTK